MLVSRSMLRQTQDEQPLKRSSMLSARVSLVVSIVYRQMCSACAVCARAVTFTMRQLETLILEFRLERLSEIRPKTGCAVIAVRQRRTLSLSSIRRTNGQVAAIAAASGSGNGARKRCSIGFGLHLLVPRAFLARFSVASSAAAVDEEKPSRNVSAIMSANSLGVTVPSGSYQVWA